METEKQNEEVNEDTEKSEWKDPGDGLIYEIITSTGNEGSYRWCQRYLDNIDYHAESNSFVAMYKGVKEGIFPVHSLISITKLTDWGASKHD